MQGVSLTAREYKLLLDASLFGAEPTLARANEVWRRRILPIVSQQLGRGAVGKKKGRLFDKTLRREIMFWDTREGHLALGSYSLRHRQDVMEDGEPRGKGEISLKLRTPDLFIAAASELPGAGEDPRTKLEEDIAPLAVKPAEKGKDKSVRVPQSRSIRTRFSLSTKQNNTAPRTFGALAKLYPSLKGNLRIAHSKLASGASKLVPGRKIQEFVFEGAKASIGAGFDIEFALTVWIFPRAKAAGAVEISYKCSLKDGTMKLEAAHRAFRLFIVLQERLGPLVETDETSKTALALPKRVGTP